MRQNLNKFRNLSFSNQVQYGPVINIHNRFVVICSYQDSRKGLCWPKTSRIVVFSLSLACGERNVLCGVRPAFMLITCHMSDDILVYLPSEYCTLYNCHVFTSLREFPFNRMINAKIYTC